MTATAAVPASLVVLAHLAVEWNGADGYEGRRQLAFQHGIALAIILAAVLVAGRVALAIERGRGHPAADAVAIVGVVGVLAHLAWVWRDDSDLLRRVDVTASHLAALLAVAAATALARWVEAGGVSSGSNPLNHGPIGRE